METSEFDADLGDLRAFCRVVDLGSVTEAARALRETKGAVSRRLSRLERNLGAALFTRSPRRVQPTEDGLAYRARVGQALELLDDAAGTLTQATAEPRCLLRVTAPQDLGTRVLAPVVASFLERYPKVKVEMLTTNAVLDFDAHQLDVAFRAGVSLPDSSLRMHKVLDLNMGFVAAPAYLKTRAPIRAPADLAAHRVLLLQGRAGPRTVPVARVDGSGEPVEVRLNPSLWAPDGLFLREAALAGAGVTLLPGLMFQDDVRRKALLPVLPGWRVAMQGGLYLLHRGAQFLPPRIRAFKEHVLTELGVGQRA